MKFQPCGDRIIIKLIPKPKVESKIITLDKIDDKPELGPFKGEVLDVGPGNGGTMPMQVAKGDIVYFDNAREFEDDDWEIFSGLYMIQNGQILGKEVE